MKTTSILRLGAAALALGFAASTLAQTAAPAGPRVLRMQSSWPTAAAAQDNFRLIAERVDRLSSGTLRIDTLSAGQVVGAFEVLDATHRRVIDGSHTISYYWVGKNKAAALFAGPPGGPFGMDHHDFLGWLWEAGGLEQWHDLYQNVLKLDVISFPAHPTSPQAFGWFKRPIRNLADFRGMKCRQTGLNAEVFQRMGMTTVNMPGGEIVPSAQRGVIDCAEWVGGIEDLRLGLHNVWKYHYTPGMHENNTVGELMFNLQTWRSLTPLQHEIIRSATRDAFLSWSVRYQRQNAEALAELRDKHGVQVLRTPPDILTAFLKAWDDLVADESKANPVFRKVVDSQRAWASVSVPAKRFMYPPYSFAANYYWPEAAKPAARPAAAKK